MAAAPYAIDAADKPANGAADCVINDETISPSVFGLAFDAKVVVFVVVVVLDVVVATTAAFLVTTMGIDVVLPETKELLKPAMSRFA